MKKPGEDNVSQDNDIGEQSVQYLTFVSGDELFAIDIIDVKEIIEMEEVTEVPMTPDFIRGVINLRGNVVPVIDLASRLGRKSCDTTRRSCIVLVELQRSGESSTVGMLVDEVREIVEIEKENTKAPPDFGAHMPLDFIKAMGRIDNQFVVLLNADTVLSVDDEAIFSHGAEQ